MKKKRIRITKAEKERWQKFYLVEQAKKKSHKFVNGVKI